VLGTALAQALLVPGAILLAEIARLI